MPLTTVPLIRPKGAALVGPLQGNGIVPCGPVVLSTVSLIRYKGAVLVNPLPTHHGFGAVLDHGVLTLHVL